MFTVEAPNFDQAYDAARNKLLEKGYDPDDFKIEVENAVGESFATKPYLKRGA